MLVRVTLRKTIHSVLTLATINVSVQLSRGPGPVTDILVAQSQGFVTFNLRHLH